MSYFTAVLSRTRRSWTAHDLDLDSASGLGALADDLRDVTDGDDPVLLLVEREDAWWAVVRVDGEEDPRVFVSDLSGVNASTYAGVLGIEDDDEAGPPEPGACAGDFDVLADLGTSPDTLRAMCDDEVLPMDALAAVANAAGFADVLDSLR